MSKCQFKYAVALTVVMTVCWDFSAAKANPSPDLYNLFSNPIPADALTPMPDVCGGYSDSWSANCRRDSNGNMIDGRNGDVYNSDGDLIQRGRSRSNFNVEPFVPSIAKPSGLDSTSSSGTTNFNGTFAGKYTMSVLFSPSSKGILRLQQSGNQVTGILTTRTGRRADVFGVVRGTQLIGTLVFTDACPGQGSMIAELSPAGDFLIGKYRASDCVGKYSGKYKLLKQ